MRKTVKSLIAFSLVVLTLLSAPLSAISNADFISANSITAQAAAKPHLNQTKKEIYVGNTFSLKLINANGKTISATKVTWTTGNSAVATVSKSGVITAKKAGTVKITATYDGQKYVATITVKPAVALTKTSATIYTGSKVTLGVTNKGKSVSASKIKWTTSDKTIATVDKNGVVAGKKAGTVKITATYNGKKYASTITVKTAVVLTKTKATIYVGDKLTLGITNKGKAVSADKITWASANKSVATVNKNGVVTAKKAGTVKITATYNGKKYTSTITVKSALVLNKTKATIYNGNKVTLSLGGISADKITWTSANTAVATVSKNGVVTGKKAGTVKITATYNGKKYTATITVKPAVVINKTKATISVGKTVALSLTEKGNAVAAGNIVWKSSNPAVATVSKKGVVTAKKAGTAKITATYKGTVFTTTITVTSTLYVDKTSLAFGVGDTSSKVVTVTVLASDTIKWEIVEGSDIVSCRWAENWETNNTIKLFITPKNNKYGNARIKILYKDYPDRCTYIDVTVKSPYSLDIKNEFPCLVSNYEGRDYYDAGEKLSTVKINNVDYEVVYGDSFKITVDFEAFASYYTEGYYYVKYRILDADGYVVEFDRRMSERMYVGDKGKIEIYVYDLPQGSYTIQFLDHFAYA